MPHSSPSSAHPVHLELESLEDRCVLSTAAYVGTLYVDLLHRAPQASEIAPWVNAIDNGISPTAIATAFTNSPEYLNGAVQASFQLYLNRPAAPSDAAPLVAALQAGLPETQLQASILASDEFFAAHGGSSGPWISGVYQKVLGRAAGPSEQASWNQALQTGLSRQTVALAIVTSPEADTRLVEAAYQAILGRAPDPASLAAWVGQLEHGMTPSQLIAAFASSSELIAHEGGLNAVVQPVGRPFPVDTFGNPFLPPLFVAPIVGITSGFTGGGFTGGFTRGGSSCGCFSGGGFSGGGSSGGGSRI